MTKAARKTAFWTTGIRRAVGIAQDLENLSAGAARYPRHPVGVEVRDGIPIDEKEQAERLSILKAAGLISVQRAVTEQLHDPGATARELSRLGITPTPD